MSINTQSEKEFVEEFKIFLTEHKVKVEMISNKFMFSNNESGDGEIWFEASQIFERVISK